MVDELCISVNTGRSMLTPSLNHLAQAKPNVVHCDLGVRRASAGAHGVNEGVLLQ